VDGRSLQLLGADLARVVNGIALHPETLQYGDYILHLNQVPGKPIQEYWKTYLGGMTSCLFPNLNVSPNGRLHAVTRQFPAHLLQGFCEMHGTTASNLIQVAWSLVLRCYTSTNDICFGYLTSGRDIALPGIENAVGLFINMLICRVQLEDSLSVLNILEQNEGNFIRSLENQHCSIAKIQHDLGFQRRPIFNSIISYQSRTSNGMPDSGFHENNTPAHLETMDIHDPTEVSISVFLCSRKSRVAILSVPFTSINVPWLTCGKVRSSNQRRG
jgi:hypothetical protein